jgi:hypothetical protein
VNWELSNLNKGREISFPNLLRSFLHNKFFEPFSIFRRTTTNTNNSQLPFHILSHTFNMFARSVIRATKVATPSQIARVSLPKVARASFTASTKRCTPPEVIAEKEVPQSSYSGGEVQRSTIIVGEDTQSSKVSPLTQNVYNTMPKTMQSLSLMGKTVVVTG